MFRIHRAAAHVDRGNVQLVDVQKIQSHARAHDIGDRIRRPHLVEMHFLDRDSVNLRFRLAQAREDGCGIRFRAGRQRSAVDQPQNVWKMAVLLRRGIEMHSEL